MGMLKIPFFRLGVWRHPQYGELKIDQPMMDKMMANFKAGLPGSPPFVRLGHDKDAAEAKATFGDVKSLGWIKELLQEGSVLCALADPTDPRVAEWIRTKQYRFASAEFEPNHISRETGQPVGPVLTAIGLTNEPFLTRLPEAVALAAPADTFYLDCEEVKPTMKLKFADAVKRLFAVFGWEVEDPTTTDPTVVPPAPAPGPAPASAPVVLPAEVQAKLARLDQLEQNQQTTAAQLEVERKARREAEIEKLSADLVREGIPPAMIEQVKPLLLADTGAVVGKVKLAVGGEKDATQTDLIVQSLRALPDSQRVPFGQSGGQGNDADKAAKLAQTVREDVLALGGTVTPDGKFKL